MHFVMCFPFIHVIMHNYEINQVSLPLNIVTYPSAADINQLYQVIKLSILSSDNS